MRTEVPRRVLVPTARLEVVSARPGDQPRPDATSALASRMSVLCASAVDPWEITAGLEAEGINDAAARAIYGHPDVFSLADELYRRVPRRPESGTAATNPWRSKAMHHLLRGVLFGLPGLCYVGASESLASSAAIGTIVVSLLLSWSASEGLSYLGYTRLGGLDTVGAKHILRRGVLLTFAVTAPATVGVGLILGADLPSIGFATGQAIYVLAATVVLVSGAEWWLLGALVPGVAASGSYLVTGQHGVPPLVWAGAGATVAATVVLALALTARPGAAPYRRLSRSELRGAVPHATFGLLAGGLITFTTVAQLITPETGAQIGHTCGPAALPLSLSMGVAEWILFRYRRRIHTWLEASESLPRFALRARGVLVLAVGAYVALVAVVASAVTWVGHTNGRFDATPTLFCTSVMLAGSVFLALALRSSGVTTAVLWLVAIAIAVEIAAAWFAPHVTALGPYMARYGDDENVQLAAFTGLFGGLLIYATVVLGRATRHR